VNAIIAHTGQLIGGPADGVSATCESGKIPAITTTELILDGGTKVQVMTGSYFWNEEKKAYLWNLETVTFPERAITE
jgi:hypothetical protein